MSGKDIPWPASDELELADSLLQAAAPALEAELEWLASCLQARLASYFGQPPAAPPLPGDIAPPPLKEPGCPYSAAIETNTSSLTRLKKPH